MPSEATFERTPSGDFEPEYPVFLLYLSLSLFQRPTASYTHLLSDALVRVLHCLTRTMEMQGGYGGHPGLHPVHYATFATLTTLAAFLSHLPALAVCLRPYSGSRVMTFVARSCHLSRRQI